MSIRCHLWTKRDSHLFGDHVPPCRQNQKISHAATNCKVNMATLPFSTRTQQSIQTMFICSVCSMLQMVDQKATYNSYKFCIPQDGRSDVFLNKFSCRGTSHLAHCPWAPSDSTRSFATVLYRFCYRAGNISNNCTKLTRMDFGSTGSRAVCQAQIKLPLPYFQCFHCSNQLPDI